MKKELTQISKGSFFKRIIAFIMDGAIALFIMFGLMALVFNPIAEKTMGFSAKKANQLRYEIASKFAICTDEDENGNQIIYDVKDLDKASEHAQYLLLTEFEDKDEDFYLSRIKYYYLNYKTGINVECPASSKPEDFRAPNYEELIDGKSPSEFYTEEWFNAKRATFTSVMDFAVEAMNDLASQEYFVTNNQSIKLIQLFVIIPPYLISFGVFFILIPLCFKNGETLGKKTLHLAFISYDGYQVKKRQIVSRQLLMFLLVGVVCFIIARIGLGSIALLGLGILIYYVATFISKDKRSPADYFAFTVLIDNNKSVWFSDPHEEEKKNNELAKNMEKYRKNKVENKNLLQVGSTIVNEDVKKELEEEKKKNKK